MLTLTNMVAATIVLITRNVFLSQKPERQHQAKNRNETEIHVATCGILSGRLAISSFNAFPVPAKGRRVRRSCIHGRRPQRPRINHRTVSPLSRLGLHITKMRLEKCYICSSTIYPGHGSVFVRNDAKQFRFCRSKCRKNFNMKRNPRKLRWTKAFRKAAGKELAIDTTFAFERRRNRAVKYDRELVAKTLSAMPVIQKVRQDREKDFYRGRMVVREVEKRKDAIRELQTGLDVVEPIVVREKLRERVEKEKDMEIVQHAQVEKAN